jgi:hypothetical protein
VRPLAATWILGGILAGIGALEYSWRSNLTAPYGWLCLAGGILIVAALIWTAALAWQFGSRLALVGLPIFFIGFLTLYFGVGVIGVIGGIALYALGVHRTRVVDRQALIFAATLLALALPAAIALHSQLVGIEVAVASAGIIGVGIVRAQPRDCHGRVVSHS